MYCCAWCQHFRNTEKEGSDGYCFIDGTEVRLEDVCDEFEIQKVKEGKRSNKMTNREWLNSLSDEELAKVCQKWLQQEHIEMPEIKIGDVIYCNICKSRARFVVMSDIYASNLNGIFIRWREKNDIWKIERMNDGTGFLEVIWRADK